jgi:hypothetical protein
MHVATYEKDGAPAVTTDSAREGVRLRADGYRLASDKKKAPAENKKRTTDS